MYLFSPFNIHIVDSVQSNVLEVFSSEAVVSAEMLIQDPTPKDISASRRIRLTNLLLRYQRELSEIESQTSLSESQKDALELLRTRIKNLEGMIAKLTQ